MKAVSLIAFAALAGCATSGEQSALPGAATADQAQDIEVAAELDLREYAKDESVVCRREAAVGSRISVDRCYSTGPGSDALDPLALQEIERQRRRRMFEER